MYSLVPWPDKSGEEPRYDVMYVCMYVCPNVFMIEIYGFTHSYVPFWHVTLMMPLRQRSRLGLGGQKTRQKQVQRCRRWSTAQQKDERQDTTCASAPEEFILLADPWMAGIGRGQHDVVSTTLRPLPFQTFHMLGVRHMMHMRIPSMVLKVKVETIWEQHTLTVINS